ncbi:Type I secretion system membrane fusion protein PrsE [Sulfurospirillum diekertiae]|uniref:Type I secretion system membrane fusion protein PrsE n=1 Tax=Sulfurospirillum diekertiae TaxID=1854492 RepID=A0A290HWD8_9BACT|nr:HlyD family type I secretion periplasmic adaptor subunit [Sulfurospirillum diekertiae]ATB70954.1 Type I secretion system membrane fusion protein PrsE [Sulfurospirillum diekertiae]
MKNEFSKPDGNDKNIIKFGLGVVIVVFVIIGGWMAFAPLASSVVSIGTVSADSNKKTVQHLEGGIVDEILVQNGDFVKEGDILLKFQNTNALAQLDILKNQYMEALVLESRLESQISSPNNIVFSDEVKKLKQTPELQNIINTQKQIFDLKQRIVMNDETITEQRIAQLVNYKEGTISLVKSKSTRLKSLEEEIGEWKILFAEQLVDKLKLRELTREKTLVEGDIANTKADMAKTDDQISELKSQLLARKKDVQDKTYAELVNAKNDLSNLKSKLVAAEDVTERLIVRAPIAGNIVGMDIHTKGGVIAAGKPILDIVPENSQLVVVTHVQTKDIDKVKEGLLADIRFSAFDTRHTNVIEGKVTNVSADSLIDQKTGAPYYEAKVELTPKGNEQVKEYNFNLVAGMPAEIMIKIENRTALNYLVKPFMDMFSRSFNEK